MIVLTRSDPERKMHRFYALAIAPTLFGEWTLMVEWGRIGSAGMVHRHTFDDEATAQATLARRLVTKMRRGYQVCPRINGTISSATLKN
jgi:predicted DNA-binding WGR domain protein